MTRKAEIVTQRMVDALHAEMSYPAMARYLGLEPRFVPTLSRIANGGPVSVAMENEVRQRLGLAPVTPPVIPVPACPDCGSVHHARCNGNGGTAVVLAPGEVIRKSKPRRYSRIDQMPVAMLARAVKERTALNEHVVSR